jgi:hypothetical protein
MSNYPEVKEIFVLDFRKRFFLSVILIGSGECHRATMDSKNKNVTEAKLIM